MSTTYRYARYDLDSSIEVARQIKERGGAVSMAELATILGYSGVNNGAFLQRLASARAYELIEGPPSQLTITRRAQDILQPDYEATAARARLDAFMAVPLNEAFLKAYEGQVLPPESGMRNALETRFGVPSKKAAPVLARLLDSAEQAGLFRLAGRTRILIPTILGERRAEQGEESKPSGDHQEAAPPRLEGTHPRFPKLLDGLLEELPNAREWNEDELKEWLDLFERGLRVYYKLPRTRNEAG